MLVLHAMILAQHGQGQPQLELLATMCNDGTCLVLASRCSPLIECLLLLQQLLVPLHLCHELALILRIQCTQLRAVPLLSLCNRQHTQATTHMFATGGLTQT